MSNLCRFNNWNDCQFVNWSDCVWYSFQDPKDPPGPPTDQPSRGGDKEKKIVPGAPTGTGVDYGRKPYLSDSYTEMMRRMPQRATLDQILKKKSQFEKPYSEDEYPEMQHWNPEPPPYDGPIPGPGPTLPPPAPSDYDREWLCSLNCDGRIGRCNDGGCAFAIGTCYAELVGVGSGGTWSVTGDPYIRILTGRNNPSFKKTYSTLDSLEIYPDWDKIEVSSTSLWGDYKWKKATFQVTYTDSDKNVCKGELTVSCCTTCACPTVPAFEYDSGNPTTIAREASATITVNNGCADFSWSVAGTGFSFVNATTRTGTNTLIADNTACGTASITVTDKCGTEVTGEVRCTAASGWVLDWTCGWYKDNSYYCESISGEYKYEVWGWCPYNTDWKTSTPCYTACSAPDPCIPPGSCPAGQYPTLPCDPSSGTPSCCDYGAGDWLFAASFINRYKWQCD